MNLKSFFLSLWCLVVFAYTHVIGQTQSRSLTTDIPLSSHYKKFFNIASVPTPGNSDFAKVLHFAAKSDGHLIIFEFLLPKSNDDQKWLIMPTSPGSDEYVIVNKAYPLHWRTISTDDGVARSLNLVTNPFTGEPRQIFKYTSVSPNQPQTVFFFNNGTNGKVAEAQPPFKHPITKRNIRLLQMENFDGSNKQKFTLREIDNINGFTSFQAPRNVSIPQPPAPTNLVGDDLCVKCEEHFVGETIIPFVMVRNDLTPELQLSQTPYYKVKRYQYYKMVGNPRVVNPGFGEKVTFSQTTGIQQFSQTTVRETLGMTFTVDANVGFAGSLFSGSAATSLSRSFELRTTQVNSLTESQSQTFTVERTVNVEQTTLYVEYQLIDRYELQRMDGTKVTDWEVARPEGDNTDRTFPQIGSSANARTTNGGSQLGKRVRVTDLAKPVYAAKIASKNPFDNALEVAITHPEACQVKVALYNQRGEEVKAVNQKLNAQGTDKVSIPAASLRNGVYILKVQTNNEVILSKRVVKE